MTPEKKPGDEVGPQFIPAIGVGISIVVGSTELIELTVGLGTLMTIGLYKVVEKYGGKVADVVLRATGFKQLSDFGDGFIGVAGSSMRHPKVEIRLKKLWFIPLPVAEKVVIKDGSKTVVEVKKGELDQVGDLFTPKEFGQLLGEAYLNGWDAGKAKKLAEDLEGEYKNFHAFYSSGYHPSCEAGPVIIKQYGARHIIKRHITQEIPGGTPWEVNSARELLDIIKQVIENPDIEECKPWKDTHRAVLHKNINGKWYTVVIERVRYWWEVVTAFPRDTPPV